MTYYWLRELGKLICIWLILQTANNIKCNLRHNLEYVHELRHSYIGYFDDFSAQITNEEKIYSHKTRVCKERTIKRKLLHIGETVRKKYLGKRER